MALLWTEPADVVSRWVGTDAPSVDNPVLPTLLEDAEDTALREFPDLLERVDGDGTTVPNTIPVRRVKKVLARVVIRHLRNPEGFRQTQEGAGPFQRGTTFGGEEPGSLYLTDEDRAELGGTLSGSAFTIDQTPQIDTPLGPQGWLTYGRTYVL